MLKYHKTLLSRDAYHRYYRPQSKTSIPFFFITAMHEHTKMLDKYHFTREFLRQATSKKSWSVHVREAAVLNQSVQNPRDTSVPSWYENLSHPITAEKYKKCLAKIKDAHNSKIVAVYKCCAPHYPYFKIFQSWNAGDRLLISHKIFKKLKERDNKLKSLNFLIKNLPEDWTTVERSHIDGVFRRLFNLHHQASSSSSSDQGASDQTATNPIVTLWFVMKTVGFKSVYDTDTIVYLPMMDKGTKTFSAEGIETFYKSIWTRTPVKDIPEEKLAYVPPREDFEQDEKKLSLGQELARKLMVLQSHCKKSTIFGIMNECLSAVGMTMEKVKGDKGDVYAGEYERRPKYLHRLTSMIVKAGKEEHLMLDMAKEADYSVLE